MSKSSKIRDSTLLQLYSRAKAPLRDYYGLTIMEDRILISTWKISHGPHLHPRSKTILLEDVKSDKYLREHIANTFGMSAFEYIESLYNNVIRLETLPKKVFLNLMTYLEIADILNLGRSSKILRELCDSDEVWKVIYQKLFNRKCYADEYKTASEIGWKELTKRKSFLRKPYNSVIVKPRNVTKTKISKTVKSAKTTNSTARPVKIK
ncbi:F-box only protein 36 [Aethina tumida]|uniref:F-box only protein 36 n=1 Tax=Aethina tumida TaxID=116153 RepID=UPI0021496825|nr:F-box only protein 36 [Aethina tumida]